MYKKKLVNHPEKKLAFYFVTIIFMLVCYRASSMALSYLSNFNVDNVLETVKTQKDYLLRVSIAQDGAAYDLGDFEPTISGISKMIIPAINVTLFRPYLWEARSIIQIFSALESAGILLLTLYLVLRRKLYQTITRIYHDPNLIMCIAFSLLFAFIVGVSSYNFGSLSRYKIPCTPFYMLFLMILIFNKDEKTNTDPSEAN